ncbi:MAG: UvrABC system protein C [Alphaproteobacteria bacterium MarineAlpha4_Bin2]|nr:MAG: UvrABC system protein C [Alphaproteobacteria bacterium MarineAlpha4_Bin2]
MSDYIRERRPAENVIAPQTNLAAGVEVIRGHLTTLPGAPGVYRMLNRRGDALYIGKARNLKKRVANYTQVTKQPYRLQRMISETASMEFVTTHTEVEALLLEANLINQLRPRYNVLLRDDKSFPYILITGDHDFPQIVKHRGAQKRRGYYFGPFATVGAVNRTITALQRAFLLRNCADTIFQMRSRPCLQYQIKRCSAPCVDRIAKGAYSDLVEESRQFLSGRSTKVQEKLAAQMQMASEELAFEQAASIRDRIRALTQVQAHQDINLPDLDEADVVGLHQKGGQSCIQVFFFRGGRNFGNRAYFPTHSKDLEAPVLLANFIAQFYEKHPPPKLILLSHIPAERKLAVEALSIRAERKVQLIVPQRGGKRRIIDHATANARDALSRRLSESASHRRLMEDLALRLDFDVSLERIEIFDNSHIQGTSPVGAMVVTGLNGFEKNAYRRFNIRQKDAAGDDYAMMREVLTRRFTRALKEDPDHERVDWPDLVIIDGGRGQLSVAEEVFADLGIDDVYLLGIAKGPDRNAGREHLYRSNRPPIILEPRDPVLYFLQRLRDEAHRFAIGSHRARRKKTTMASPLDEISGVGTKRKKALLLHFGSAQSVARAGLTDLEMVQGISRAVARKIYGYFHEDQ